jgi:tryptophan-rich sensory protein
MGVASWMVWRSRTGRAKPSLRLFGAQLALNVLWSALFFGLRRPGAALVDIVLLWGGIVATTAAFWRSSRVAAWLMAPYALWTTFAAALNFEIWRLNR